MKIDVLTIFPEMFKGPMSESILKIAQEKGLLKIKIHDIRDWAEGKHKKVDDKPFGGGSGMLMQVQPVYKALKDLVKDKEGTLVILMSPQGRKFSQKISRDLSKRKRILLICGHYEGFDERIRSLVDDEISIGDYVLTGGELPACIIIDSVSRLVSGVLGAAECLEIETFDNNLIEYPQYTRPRKFKGMKVPDVLLSGDHKKIDKWRIDQAHKRTKQRRPDLYKKVRRGEVTSPASE